MKETDSRPRKYPCILPRKPYRKKLKREGERGDDDVTPIHPTNVRKREH